MEPLDRRVIAWIALVAAILLIAEGFFVAFTQEGAILIQVGVLALLAAIGLFARLPLPLVLATTGLMELALVIYIVAVQ